MQGVPQVHICIHAGTLDDLLIKHSSPALGMRVIEAMELPLCNE